MKKHNLKGDLIFVLRNDMHISSELESTIKLYGLKYYIGYQLFMQLNPRFGQTTYHTLLVGTDNKVKLAGSPIENPDLWKLYKEVLTK